MGRGWQIAAEHFVERYGLIVMIALGESIIAIGIGAGSKLDTGTLVAVVLGVVLVSALWWLYFDVAAIFGRTRLVEASGLERARLARDSYGYLHLPLVAGIVLLAFGIESTLHQVREPLLVVSAVALCGGTALYLIGHITFLFRATRYVFRRRTIGAVVLLALIPAALVLPALAFDMPGAPPFGEMFFGALALLQAGLVVPLPSGGGGIEVAFLSGFAGDFPPAKMVIVLLLWRFYTTILLTVLGVYLLVRTHGGQAAKELFTVGWFKRRS